MTMYPEIEQQVEQLFADALRRSPDFCGNPVTGDYFVPGHDPVRPQKERAIRALRAQLRFAAEKSPDMPDLPLNEREDDFNKWQSGLHYLIAAYTCSLRS